MPGFGQLEINSVVQLLYNYADERMQQVFIERTAKAELQAASDLPPGEGNDNFKDNTRLVNVVEDILPILRDQCNADCDDVKFLSACAKKGFDSQNDIYMSTTADKKSFAINHSLRTVQYSAAGFCNGNRSRLSESVVGLLRDSTNQVVRELAKAIDDKTNASKIFSERCKVELQEVLGLVRDDKVDLHFVKCIMPNRNGKTNREDGCFDWPLVTAACEAHGVFQAAKGSKGKRFEYRRTYSDFWAEFGCLAIGSFTKVRENPKQAIDDLIEKEKEFITKQARGEIPEVIRVGAGMVMMTAACARAIRSRLAQAEMQMASLAEMVQQAARGYTAGEELTEQRQRLQKLQACVRRRRVLGTELSAQKSRRQLYGMTRLLQTAELFKKNREEAIVIESHLRTALAVQRYRKRRSEETQELLANILRGKWKTFEARRILQNFRSDSAEVDRLWGYFEALRSRKQLGNFIQESKVVALQTLRRQVNGKRQAEEMKQEREDKLVFAAYAQTLLMRTAMMQAAKKKTAAKLAAVRRGVMARREVARSVSMPVSEDRTARACEVESQVQTEYVLVDSATCTACANDMEAQAQTDCIEADELCGTMTQQFNGLQSEGECNDHARSAAVARLLVRDFFRFPGIIQQHLEIGNVTE
jgi:myosin heavy subunit